MLVAMGIFAFVLIGLGIHHLSLVGNSVFLSWEEDSMILPLFLGLAEIICGVLLLGHILT